MAKPPKEPKYEWRFFFPLGDQATDKIEFFDIKELKKLKPDNPEVRSDIYVSVGNVGIGLKFRDVDQFKQGAKPILELKTRTESDGTQKIVLIF